MEWEENQQSQMCVTNWKKQIRQILEDDRESMVMNDLRWLSEQNYDQRISFFQALQ